MKFTFDNKLHSSTVASCKMNDFSLIIFLIWFINFLDVTYLLLDAFVGSNASSSGYSHISLVFILLVLTMLLVILFGNNIDQGELV